MSLYTGQGQVNYILKLFVFGDNEDEDPLSEAEKGSSKEAALPPAELSGVQYILGLLLCIAGLQGSYLTWGLLQVSAP